MTRSSNTEKSLRLNAAFDLLAQGYTVANAADALTQKFGLSRRQAYRYLQEAQEIDGPVLVVSPSIPITIKMPEDVVIQLRSHAQTSGMTIGEIVAHAIVSFLDKLHRHG
jgi:predicted DNA-binding transcriptional regulator YafY